MKDQDKEELQGSDWDNPVASHIEELLTKNLSATLCSALKKIVESGYTKEVAETAILYSSLFNGSKDTVFNVVDSALTTLKREKEMSIAMKFPVFERPPDGGLKGGADVSDTPDAKDYYSSIRFDETLQEYIVEDIKDEAIRILVPHKCKIEKELQGWTEWANEKVMHAAQRLGKARAELEKLKKVKHALVDSTIKQLSELEYAMTNATGQIQVANCTVARIEEEHDLLMNDMEAAKMRAMRVATNLHSATEREQETLRKMQSLDADKAIIQDQLTDLKHQITALNNRLEKARGRKVQFKALWKQEEKEKTKAQNKIDSLRRKLEEEEAAMKIEAENIKQAAEKEMQKCTEDIKRIQKMVMELSFESEKSKKCTQALIRTRGVPPMNWHL
ncbi:hypothetical protein SASPL_109388 [Salvia splendens]|uniref:Uncharacterized protein n=1 Tax=Salvia splendens TaxID=180675 RepID=A0A8X9A949_SALSN|nr:hypothetical protein SASPL_109388 [Salvia splendens]